MFTSSVPSFWLGLLLMQLFSVKLGWLPVSGYGGPDASFATRLSHLVLPAVEMCIRDRDRLAARLQLVEPFRVEGHATALEAVYDGLQVFAQQYRV